MTRWIGRSGIVQTTLALALLAILLCACAIDRFTARQPSAIVEAASPAAPTIPQIPTPAPSPQVTAPPSQTPTAAPTISGLSFSINATDTAAAATSYARRTEDAQTAAAAQTAAEENSVVHAELTKMALANVC
jgi:hypothetical protein